MIYDITQELITCEVYDGDPLPKRTQIMNMNSGSTYNMSSLELCVHNGTHVDAPYHFINDGNTIDKISLERFVGNCFVYETCGNLSEVEAELIMMKAKEAHADKRILLKGDVTVTLEAARVFANHNIFLLGNESQSVGPINSPKAVHLELLNKDIVLLEGIRLRDVPCGVYFLSAAPLNIKGSDGSPCRAYVMTL